MKNYTAESEAIWDTLSNKNAMHYILTGRKDWKEEDFFNKGKEDVNRCIDFAKKNTHLKFGKVLDFGCGIGRLSENLINHFEQVVGVDVSKEMIKKAKNNKNTKVEYIHDSTYLQCVKHNFDLVFSLLVLQHIPTPDQIVYYNRFYDMLNKGGHLLFSMIDTNENKPIKYREYRKDGFWIDLLSKSQIIGILSSIGFEYVNSKSNGINTLYLFKK